MKKPWRGAAIQGHRRTQGEATASPKRDKLFCFREVELVQHGESLQLVVILTPPTPIFKAAPETADLPSGLRQDQRDD